MKSFTYPMLSKSILIFENFKAAAILYDPDEITQFEIDDEMLYIIRQLDGNTNPSSIDGVSEERVLEAIAELESYGLIEHPHKRSKMILRAIQHPLMLGIMLVMAMVDTFLTGQKVFFFITALFLCAVLFAYIILDCRRGKGYWER